MKEFLASPARVFNAINWLLLAGALIALIFVPTPQMPGIKWLLFVEWLAFVSLYVFLLRSWRRGRA